MTEWIRASGQLITMRSKRAVAKRYRTTLSAPAEFAVRPNGDAARSPCDPLAKCIDFRIEDPRSARLRIVVAHGCERAGMAERKSVRSQYRAGSTRHPQHEMRHPCAPPSCTAELCCGRPRSLGPRAARNIRVSAIETRMSCFAEYRNQNCSSLAEPSEARCCAA